MENGMINDCEVRRIGSAVLFFVILAGGLAVTQGCGAPNAKGPSFTEVKEMQADCGLVYIYRPIKGSSMCNTVRANDERVFMMHNGGYHPYFAKPGKVEFKIRGGGDNEPVVINVAAGKVYYLRGTTGWNAGSSLWWCPIRFEVVSAEVGAEQIKGCKLENN